MNRGVRCVIDASVTLKWTLDDEDHVQQALALRDAWLLDGTLEPVAPSLWLYETLNALSVAVRRKRVAPVVGLEILNGLLGANIPLVDPEPTRVYQVAHRCAISAYDAAYVALGEALGCIVWTGDRSLVKAAARLHPNVRWIGEYVQGALA